MRTAVRSAKTQNVDCLINCNVQVSAWKINISHNDLTKIVDCCRRLRVLGSNGLNGQWLSNDWHGLMVSSFCTSQPSTRRWTVSTRVCRGRRRIRRWPTRAERQITFHVARTVRVWSGRVNCTSTKSCNCSRIYINRVSRQIRHRGPVAGSWQPDLTLCNNLRL